MTSDNDVYSLTFESKISAYFGNWSEDRKGVIPPDLRLKLRRLRFHHSKPSADAARAAMAARQQEREQLAAFEDLQT